MTRAKQMLTSTRTCCRSHEIPPKRRYVSNRLEASMFQKVGMFVATALKNLKSQSNAFLQVQHQYQRLYNSNLSLIAVYPQTCFGHFIWASSGRYKREYNYNHRSVRTLASLKTATQSEYK